MLETKVIHSPIIMRAIAYMVIGALGISILLFFSQPNRLAHDQIDHKLVMITNQDQGTFQGDYIWGTPKYAFLDNHYSIQFLQWLGEQFDDEIARWLLVPVVFFIFTIGMFEVFYYMTKNALSSLFVALLSNIHIVPIFVTEWGLPGPSELDPWVFVNMFYPFLFLGFYHGVKHQNERLLFFVFLFSGILANLHLIMIFNIVGIFLLTYLFMNKWKGAAILRALLYGLTTILASTPFLLTYFVGRAPMIAGFDPTNPLYMDAISNIAYHVTLPGRLLTLRMWLIDQWYIVWVGLALFIITGLRSMQPRTQSAISFKKFGIFFISATLIFNALYSLMQITRLYMLNQIPDFNEPRGIPYMYIIFFIALAIILTKIYERIKQRIGMRGISKLFLTATVVGVIVAWFAFPTIAAFSKRQTTASYTHDSCDSELYRVLNSILSEGDSILVDPTYYSAIRICTRHPIVVHSRDKATAYTHGADVMREWYIRYHEVKQAFDDDNGDAVVAAAKKYNARVIVSRQCVEIDEQELSMYKKIHHPELEYEGCIYKLK